MQSSYDTDKRKLLSSLSHGSIFFSTLVLSAGLPLALMIISDDEVVKGNAREALNFHFNIWLYTIIFGVLAFFLVGIPLLFVVGIVQVLMPILAIVHALRQPDSVYRYPFIFRLL